MSATTPTGEALRKEGVFVPTQKAGAQKSRKSGDKNNEGTHTVVLPRTTEKEQIMENVTSPAVGGTNTNKPVTAPVDPFEAQLAAMLQNALAATAATVPPAPPPIFSARRSATLAVDTIVVTATAAALLGAGYGIYRVATKAK